MKRITTFRKAAELSPLLRKKLDFYTVAASAAGVGILALAHPVEAEIVYTPTNQWLGLNTYIDLNHDGKPDFSIFHTGTGYIGTRSVSVNELKIGLAPYAPSSNGAVGATLDYYLKAFALPAGQEIGPNRNFGRVAGIATHTHYYYRSIRQARWFGQWANQGKGLNNRYAGVRFVISGELHYGWIRISVKTNTKDFEAKMTGYAYETIANKPILAGATKESGESQTAFESPAAPSVEPVLGAFALGAPGLSLWRKE